MWEFPGGKLDEGQDVGHCIEKEVMEETSLFVRIADSIGYFESSIVESGKYKGMPMVLIVAIGELVGGNIKISDEHAGFKWLTKDEGLALNLTPDTRKALISLAR